MNLIITKERAGAPALVPSTSPLPERVTNIWAARFCHGIMPKPRVRAYTQSLPLISHPPTSRGWCWRRSFPRCPHHPCLHSFSTSRTQDARRMTCAWRGVSKWLILANTPGPEGGCTTLRPSSSFSPTVKCPVTGSNGHLQTCYEERRRDRFQKYHGTEI